MLRGNDCVTLLINGVQVMAVIALSIVAVCVLFLATNSKRT